MVNINDDVRAFLSGRRIASLATRNEDGTVHAIAVWYLFENGVFYMSTSSGSRTGQNILRSPFASIMVDRREEGREKGVSAWGQVIPLSGADEDRIKASILARYITEDGMADPKVGPFFVESNNLTVKIEPEKLARWDMSALDDEVFSGRLQQRRYLRDLQR